MLLQWASMVVPLRGLGKHATRPRRNDGIVAGVANLHFPDSCSSYLILTNKKINQLSRKLHKLTKRTTINLKAVCHLVFVFELLADWESPRHADPGDIHEMS
ncbi:hypothetical protein Y032_0017g3417 [Ancylostoma ceylanicum]|uniref:Uncharacterized protein n=1 Tax=Ancylostoma ceylanicum TaxID=53326 RepID=A0A016V5P1_9BILA|nr:hypothetical protein Y032_0017g3417 [Ancylostoma ceylanicum]